MFCVWVKSKQGIRMVGDRWESVFSWHLVQSGLPEAEAQLEASKITPTRESPAVVVRHESDPLY